ncbi:superoxide dismutase copper/zinc-binding protein [Paenibacillus sp. TCA20]|uniref:superoxide dismutase family protein n=1 Tax=Paenibacillus sp. TCA20 TaxID=1499968 RepID=UPI0004D6F32D|nr:superoxide dismutase family protein [Paenibacillus sp. TCA20]GAK41766.1 superoxide dismutase copper/zinc-binding protein [Paenibacillus sp. TCA20]
MKKRKYETKHMAGAFLAGAVLFSGFSLAAASPDLTLDSLKQSATKLSVYVNGEDKSSANGEYDNAGTAAPEYILHNDTTYVPVRMVSELVNQPVYWDEESHSISLGVPAVPLFNAEGEEAGFATLEQTDEGVVVKVTATGLTPGKHGFHVHENPVQGTDFETAGGHFNPTDKHHGLEHPEGSHVGDMHNLEAGQDGTVEAEVLLPEATLEKEDAHSVLGRSLIIHAGEDDHMTDPSGDSGGRVLGGNIPE